MFEEVVMKRRRKEKKKDEEEEEDDERMGEEEEWPKWKSLLVRQSTSLGDDIIQSTFPLLLFLFLFAFFPLLFKENNDMEY